MSKPLTETMAFEDDVRRVAEAIWRLDAGEIQPAWYRQDPVLRELDGIARLPDATHLLMATTSTRLRKVQEDVAKLNRADNKEKKRGVPTKQWLITEQQLSAEHIDYARRKNVECLAFAQFRDRFFNGRDYLSKRRGAAFGSARNLRDGSVTVPEDEYIELPMTFAPVKGSDQSLPVTWNSLDLAMIVSRIEDGGCVCLLGPFGAGKSLTTRELFLALAKPYLRDGVGKAPIALNLREHWGAVYGDEILERHARSLGFTPRENLTVAWRAGIIHLLIDGFDEVATQAIARTSDKSFMRRTRYEALQAVRDLIGKAPTGVGIFLCGRDHYFDDFKELRHSLGLVGRDIDVVKLDEFTETSARKFLRKNASSADLPDWLPRKPLLLGYLAHQKLLDDILKIDASEGFGAAWNSFLDLVCQRESEHERASMDAHTIRCVLERLGCVARSGFAGNGAISGLDLAEAFRAETGDIAGEGVLMQLQRLPGLTPREQDPTARSFVDTDFLSALQGSAVARCVLESESGLVDRRWVSGLSRDGMRMASYLLSKQGFTTGAVIDIAHRFARDSSVTPALQQLAADCFSVALELADDEEIVDARGLHLADADFPVLDLEFKKVQSATLRDCSVGDLIVGEGLNESGIMFEGCVVSKVAGVPSEGGLPSQLFSTCEFGDFDNASTNAAILKLDVPPGLKALMTVLRKLYLQAGGGRKMSALKRGVPGGGPVYLAIDEVVAMLQDEQLVATSGDVVHPVRKHSARVRKILEAGGLSDDSLVQRAKAI